MKKLIFLFSGLFRSTSTSMDIIGKSILQIKLVILFGLFRSTSISINIIGTRFLLMLAVLAQRKAGQASRRPRDFLRLIWVEQKIVLERSEFNFSVCSETVNPFPGLGYYRWWNYLILGFRDLGNPCSETLKRFPIVTNSQTQ